MDQHNGTRRIAMATMVWLLAFGTAAAKIITLQNGLEYQGRTTAIASLGDDVLSPLGTAGDTRVELIVVIDDGLRRTFVSKYQVTEVRDEVENLARIRLKSQPVNKQGNRLGNIGSIVGITPFDPYGRRTFSMLSTQGRVDVVQGITMITPVWTRVDALKSGKPFVWDMRIATSSIPRDKLREILQHHLDFTDADVRLNIVRLYMQSERYGDAEDELRAAIADFPKLRDLDQQLKELRQLRSKQQLAELRLRSDAGQHALVQSLLKAFPVKDVAGEILLEVGEIGDAFQTQRDQAAQVLETLGQQIETIEAGPRRDLFNQFLAELTAEMNFNSLSRMADYIRLLPDQELTTEQKLALALSGWLMGGSGTDNLAVSASLWKVREIVDEYLNTSDVNRRAQLLAEIASLDGGSPRYVSRILATLKPPRRTPGLLDRWIADEEIRQQQQQTAAKRNQPAGLFELETSSFEEDRPFSYVVQLPPEYDANRRYPTIVTLHAAGSTPQMQIDWWAGSFRQEVQQRLGQATRRGYIIVAPAWSRPRQRQYEYTAREHAAALYSLRDACQRFSVDTDRVYLTGHSMGGDAAWDIGLAHPDLWAGVLPVAAVAEYGQSRSPKYVSKYWDNGRTVPLYFVGGALDAVKIDRNARDFNRYLTNTGFNTTVVEYLGRGHEHFQDEIQRMFTWMEGHRRDPFPLEFEVNTMRPWDNFFWWVEADPAGMPAGAMILPVAWGKNVPRATTISGSVREKKNVFVKSGASRLTIWLTPEMVDLDANVGIYVNGKRRRMETPPTVEVLLEDARQRGDRQHPFWVKLDIRTGRGR